MTDHPAFPTDTVGATKGLTAREFYAAFALAGLLAQTEDIETDSGYRSEPVYANADKYARMAREAFMAADAMLEAEKGVRR